MSPEPDVSTGDMFDKINSLLKSNEVTYRTIEHSAIDGTAGGSSKISGTKPEQGAKTLLMVSNKKPIMVVLRGPDKLDFKAIKKATSSDDVRFASPDEIKKITSIPIGSLPPFGNLFGIPTYVDELLINEGEIACGTGLPTKTIITNSIDYKNVSSPIVGDFVKHQ